MDLANGGSEQGFQALSLLGNTGGFHTIGAGHFLHLPQNHFRVGDKVGVHFQPLFIGVQMHPVRLQVGHTTSLLQEQNVGSDRCTRSGLEGIVWQPYGSQQIRSLSNVLSHRGIFLVHGALACNECHHAAGAHLVQGTGKEIVVDKKIVLVVLLVQNLERPKGHVANGHIKEAVRQIGLFKSLYRNAVLLVQLLGNAPGNAVQLHAVHFGIFHILRQQTHEVAHAAAGFQNIAGLEAQIGQPLVHGPDHHRRGVERRQGGFPGGGVFVLGQQGFQLGIMGVGFLKELGQAAPADVLGENVLFIWCSQTVFGFQLVQQFYGMNIVVEAFNRDTRTQIICADVIVSAVTCGNFGMERMGPILRTLGGRQSGKRLCCTHICHNLTNKGGVI